MPVLAVLTSGGDAPGMNAAVVTAAKVGAAAGWTVLGVREGYEGLMAGDFTELRPGEVGRAWKDGGTFLGSARSAAFRTAEGRARAAEKLAGVDALIVVGGNGSLTGAHRLAVEHGVRVVGVPASIDHDIACTGAAIGVDTALNTIVEAADRVSDTARSHRRVFVMEVMGRECGYLAMAAAIAAAADAVAFREQGRSEDELVADLHAAVRRAFGGGRRRVLAIKAEGVAVPTARLVERLGERLAADGLSVDVRGIVLGHLVRGGAPSFRDRLVAGRLTHAAVRAAMDGAGDVMVGWEPPDPDGRETVDPKVRLFDLATVLERTRALLDGTHPVTRARVRMLQAVQGILPL